jgi:hypothetical protein
VTISIGSPQMLLAMKLRARQQRERSLATVTTVTRDHLDPTLDAIAARLDPIAAADLAAWRATITVGQDADPVTSLQDARVPETTRRAIRALATAAGVDLGPLLPWQQPWDGADRYADVLAASTAFAMFALTAPELEAVPEYRSELLGYALWFITVGPSGKYTTRYRSTGALAAEALRDLRHEHVYPRRAVKAQLLAAAAADPDPGTLRPVVQATLATSVGAVVTREEHRLVSRYDQTHPGWARYAAAGVTVIDMADGAVLDTARA